MKWHNYGGAPTLKQRKQAYKLRWALLDAIAKCKYGAFSMDLEDEFCHDGTIIDYALEWLEETGYITVSVRGWETSYKVYTAIATREDFMI
jgi:hypothetical protein